MACLEGLIGTGFLIGNMMAQHTERICMYEIHMQLLQIYISICLK